MRPLDWGPKIAPQEWDSIALRQRRHRSLVYLAAILLTKKEGSETHMGKFSDMHVGCNVIIHTVLQWRLFSSASPLACSRYVDSPIGKMLGPKGPLRLCLRFLFSAPKTMHDLRRAYQSIKSLQLLSLREHFQGRSPPLGTEIHGGLTFHE